MMFELPLTDGASSIIWSGESCGIGERLRIECKAVDSWLIHSETNESHDDEWGEGGVGLDGYRSMWTSLVMDLRFKAHADLVLVDLMTIEVKGKAEVPRTEPVKFARMTGKGGWWVKWTSDGEDQSGTPIISIEFKRPLSAEEMIVALKKMTAAFGPWDGERS